MEQHHPGSLRLGIVDYGRIMMRPGNQHGFGSGKRHVLIVTPGTPKNYPAVAQG